MIDGYTGDQRFYLGWAQVWRRNYREANLRQRLLTDPHSPSVQRVWIVRNLDPWYAAYKVDAGQKMYLRAGPARPGLVKRHGSLRRGERRSRPRPHLLPVPAAREEQARGAVSLAIVLLAAATICCSGRGSRPAAS